MTDASDGIDHGSQHQHLHELAESIHEVIWLTDATNAKMLYVSPAYERIFSRSCAALYANPRDWLDAVHPDDRARMAAFAASPPTAACLDRYRVVRRNGAVRTVEIKVFPIVENGVVVRVAGVGQDITDRLSLRRKCDRRRSWSRSACWREVSHTTSTTFFAAGPLYQRIHR